MGKGEKPILSVRIDADLLARVDEMADLAGVGRAEVVERCLAIGLVNQEKFVKVLKNPVANAVYDLITLPKIWAAVGTLLLDDGEVDPVSRRLIEGTAKARKTKRGKPAVG